MRSCLYWLSLTVAVLLATHGARAENTFTFTTLPDPGDVSGTAGSTVGWGYSITNNSLTDALDLTGIDSTLYLATDGVPDASIFDFPVLAPNTTVTEDYDPMGFFGLFQFTWNPDVPVGTTETGYFTLYGAFCDPSVDMFCGDDGGTVLSTNFATADYTATVSSSVGTPVSEPSSLLLLLSGLCGIGLWSWRRQKHSEWRPAL
jgi:hypothetical protein